MKKKITFTEDCDVLDHNKEVVESFKAGKTYNLEYPKANRWLRRNKAVEGGKKPAETEPTDSAKMEPEAKADNGKGKGGKDSKK